MFTKIKDVLTGIVFGAYLMGYIAFSWVKYWLRLGPKPGNGDFN